MTINTVPEIEQARGKQASVVRNAGVTLIASVYSIAIGLASGILVARTLGPELKGNVDLVIATIGLCVMVFGLSLTSGIVFWTAKGGINPRKLAQILIGIALFQALASGFALVLIKATPLRDAFVPPLYSNWILVLIVIGVWGTLQSGYWRSFLVGQQLFVTTAKIDVVYRTVTVAALFVAVFLTYGQLLKLPMAIIVATVSITAAFALALGFLTWNRITYSMAHSGLKDVWQYARPSYFGNFVQYLNYRLDVFLVAYFVGVRELGYYTLAVVIAQLLWLPASSLQSVLFPRLTSLDDPAVKMKETARFTRMVFALTLAMAIVVVIFGNWAIQLLYGSRFSDSYWLLLLLLPGIVALSGANILSAYISAIGKPRLNLVVALVALAATIVCNLSLLPSWGIQGASVSSSISYIITMVLTLWIVHKETGVTMRQFLFVTRSDLQLAHRIVLQVTRRFMERYT